MVLKFLMNTLVMNIGSKFHLYFDEVFEDMKKFFLEKYIPKNNKLFLGINCTQRTPIIELFLERFRKV